MLTVNVARTNKGGQSRFLGLETGKHFWSRFEVVTPFKSTQLFQNCNIWLGVVSATKKCKN